MEATFFIDGREIFKTKGHDLNMNCETEKVDVASGKNLKLFAWTYSKTYTIDLENVQVHDKSFLETNKPYKLIGNGYRLPKGVKLPKKKRLRKKYFKKYGYTFEIDNCYIKL